MLFRPRLTPTLLKQFIYCPRLAWIQYNTGALEDVTPSMDVGRKVDLEKKAKRLNLPRPWRLEKKYCHPTHNICGTPDIVAGERRKIVVEIKRFERSKRMSRHFIEQTRIYAWLVQSSEGGVWKYALVLGEKIYEWEYTQHDTVIVENLVNRAERILGSSRPPTGVRDGRCLYCSLRNHCGSKPQWSKGWVIFY